MPVEDCKFKASLGDIGRQCLKKKKKMMVIPLFCTWQQRNSYFSLKPAFQEAPHTAVSNVKPIYRLAFHFAGGTSITEELERLQRLSNLETKEFFI
jgi:hypothetical protein